MVCTVQRAADPGNVGFHPGGGLIMGGQHGADRPARVGTQGRLDCGQRRAFAPGAFDHLNVQPVALAQVDPAVAEHPEPRGKNGVAGRQRVADRRLPAPRTGRGQDNHLTAIHVQHALHPLHRRAEQPGEGGRTMIQRGHVAGLAQRLGNVRRTGNEDGVLQGHRTVPFWGADTIAAESLPPQFFRKIFSFPDYAR